MRCDRKSAKFEEWKTYNRAYYVGDSFSWPDETTRQDDSGDWSSAYASVGGFATCQNLPIKHLFPAPKSMLCCQHRHGAILPSMFYFVRKRVLKSESFLELSLPLVKVLVREGDLQVDEADLFKAVQAWVERDPHERRMCVDQVRPYT